MCTKKKYHSTKVKCAVSQKNVQTKTSCLQICFLFCNEHGMKPTVKVSTLKDLCKRKKENCLEQKRIVINAILIISLKIVCDILKILK